MSGQQAGCFDIEGLAALDAAIGHFEIDHDALFAGVLILNGDNEAAKGAELVNQILRRRAQHRLFHQNGIEGRFAFPAVNTVPNDTLHVFVIFERVIDFGCLHGFAERILLFDGIHPLCQFGEYGGFIVCTIADLQHVVRFMHPMRCIIMALRKGSGMMWRSDTMGRATFLYA